MMVRKNKHILKMLEDEKERLFQYASYRLHDIKDVEDALQNICCKLLSNPDRFSTVDNLRAYMYRMLGNECNDMLRRNDGIDFLDDINSSGLDNIDLQPENFDEEFMMINRLLAILPSEQSEVIRLRHHSELPFREIADIMQVPVATVKARYRYGIEKIRKGLKDENLI